MAVILIGEIANQCDNATGFNGGGADTDIFVEPPASIGTKVSGSIQEYYTTALGPTAPYNFSVGGAEEGYHIIMWFNGLTPLDTIANGGIAIIVGNGTSRGQWYVGAAASYTGGFEPFVIDTAADFSNIAAGAWTLTGNPAQLGNITQMGGRLSTTTTIMGNFNNALIDQITLGLGLRIDGGSVGTPNVFANLAIADEETNYWGWWTSSQGAFVARGKALIGPANGTSTSVFNDSAFTVNFADAPVAAGFYEIRTQGTGTDVTWELDTIAAANPTRARWSLTIDSNTNSFSDTNGVWSGSDTVSLSVNASLTGTTFINGSSILLNGGFIDSASILNANTISGESYVTVTNDIANITNSDFNFSAGHAIEITTAGTYSFTGNTFTGYGADATNDAAIHFNPTGGTGNLVINVSDGDTPTVRNSSSGTVTINNNVNVTFTGLPDNTEVRIFEANTTTEVAGIENATTGTVDNRSFTFSDSPADLVDIRFVNKLYEVFELYDFSIPASSSSIPITLRFDRNYI